MAQVHQERWHTRLKLSEKRVRVSLTEKTVWEKRVRLRVRFAWLVWVEKLEAFGSFICHCPCVLHRVIAAATTLVLPCPFTFFPFSRLEHQHTWLLAAGCSGCWLLWLLLCVRAQPKPQPTPEPSGGNPDVSILGLFQYPTNPTLCICVCMRCLCVCVKQHNSKSHTQPTYIYIHKRCACTFTLSHYQCMNVHHSTLYIFIFYPPSLLTTLPKRQRADPTAHIICSEIRSGWRKMFVSAVVTGWLLFVYLFVCNHTQRHTQSNHKHTHISMPFA